MFVPSSSSPSSDPRFEGHDEVVRGCARILRRANEFSAWPARTSPAFAQLVATAADDARLRAANSVAFLRRSAATTPALAHAVAALEHEWNLAARAPVRGQARTPLTAVIARTSTCREVIEAAELLERIERRTIDAITLETARARSRRVVDWKSPADVDWQLAVAAEELEFALQSLPPDFTPRARHTPLDVRRASNSRFPWQSLFLSGGLSSLVALVIMRGLLAALTRWSGSWSWTHCSGGSELEGLSNALCSVAKGAGLLVAAGALSFLGFLVAFSVFTLLLLKRADSAALR